MIGSYRVHIRAVFNAGVGHLLNLSANGAYIATPMFLLPQAQVKLQIVIRDEKRWIETEAVVAWENRGKIRKGGLPPGYGFRFIKVSEDTAEEIQKLVGNSGSGGSPSIPHPHVADTVKFQSPSGPTLDSDFADEPDGPPYRLQEEVLRAETPKGLPGIFVLAYDRTQDARVGRADDDLRATLTGFVGEYAYFYHEVIEDAAERYHRECELFHRLGGDSGQLDNVAHPVAPADSALVCPVCARE
jgi:hypothetical protein